MAGPSLLERIARSVDGARVQGGQADIASVVANLREIFNARQGSSTARPDYGMPDFGDLTFGFTMLVPEIAQAIAQQIQRFEPRLADVQVRPREDADSIGAVRFAIRARLVGDEAGPVVIDGALSGDGRLEVQA